MSDNRTRRHVELPAETREKLESFRRRLWAVKLAEAVLAALFGLLVSYLIVFALDRVGDTPAWLRGLILVVGSTGVGLWLPLKWHRWVWRTQGLPQVARLLRRAFPRLGDQLLGIVELAGSDLEQTRSETLCRAAMRQVQQEARGHDFLKAIPNPRHRPWAWAAGITAVVALTALIVVPAAGSNALLRWLMPWRATPRYTFTQLGDLPQTMVVPYAEPFGVTAALATESVWLPPQASARYGRQQPVRAPLRDGSYSFQLPPQKDPSALTIFAGDAKRAMHVEPTLRPELTRLAARIVLPDYLRYPSDRTQDIRGGSLSVLKGSRVSLEGEATRELSQITVAGREQSTQGARVVTSPFDVDTSSQVKISWRDHLGLSARQPFVLSIQAVDDGAPSISVSGMPREQVVLEDEVVTFQLQAQDDFGVQQIGVEWAGIEDPLRNPHPTQGEKILAAGEPQDRKVTATGVFSAAHEGVKPQSLEIRLYAVDFLPGRQRVYSNSYVLHVLTPEEHAIWLTQQLRAWFRQAQDVYERESRLHETNKQLRALSADEIDRPENRRRIETQAAAEVANAQRLSAVTDAGEKLIRMATRNDQFNVATLESWATMLLSLRNIAKERMPSVADLLKDAAQAPGSGAPQKPQADDEERGSAPQVGTVRHAGSDGSDASKPPPPGKVPSIVDVESSLSQPDISKTEKPPADSPPAAAGRLTLPSTLVPGGGPAESAEDAQCPAQQGVAEAVEQQQELLAEFAKVAEELQKILSQLEGSTFVKRLKAASRHQLEVATELNSGLSESFGLADGQRDDATRQSGQKITEREIAESRSIYLIQEDLEAYYQRVREGKFATVVKEMKDLRVASNLRDIADSVAQNLGGQSIAQAEFWADTLDRWAEQLVGPG